MIEHVPDFYIGGIRLQDGNWEGEFLVSTDELIEYAEHDVKTIEQYDAVLCMIQAQQEYALWWNKQKRLMNSKK